MKRSPLVWLYSLVILVTLPLYAGVGEPLVRWERAEVKVCFGDGDDIKTQKLDISVDEIKSVPSVIKNALIKKINEQFSAPVTGIHFSGWESCSKTPDADAFIFFSERSSSSDIGQDAELTSEGLKKSKTKRKAIMVLTYRSTNSQVIKLSPLQSFLWTAVHEFGHLSGLRHENVRDEHRDDKFCQHLESKNEFFEKSTVFYTPYDPFSILSYCYNDWVNRNGLEEKNIGLSEGDKFTLACIYKETKDSRCPKVEFQESTSVPAPLKVPVYKIKI